MAPVRFPKRPSGLTPEQKVASALLLFLGIGGLIIGFLSFGANLRRPFQEQFARAPQGFELESQREARELEAMKHRDTDGDGLTDYDEIYVFRTSPYLADTDGDGLSDYDEVYGGTDPNCPAGRECGIVVTEPAPITSIPEPPPPPVEMGGFVDGLGFTGIDDVVLALKSMPVQDMRILLVDSGIPEEELSAMTDEQIRVLFTEAVDAVLEEQALQSPIAPNP